MTPHDHTTLVPGCYRCELGRDEAMSALAAERDELRAALCAIVDTQNNLKIEGEAGNVEDFLAALADAEGVLDD